MSPSGRDRIVIVGAGLGGLAAACHLAGRGHDVTVVEREGLPGGRAGRLVLDGYTFDTGPTVLTMPDILEATFAAAGTRLEDHLTLVPLDPVYRACFADGSTLRVRRDPQAMEAEIREHCGAADAAAFVAFRAWLRDLYALELRSFIDRNYDSPLDLLRPPGPALALLRLGGFRRMAGTVARRFSDERLQRLLSFQSLYAGLAPYQALALYCVITYMDTVAGVYAPAGGMHEVAAALATAATKAGATIELAAPVDRIELAGGSDGPVRGVRLASGDRIAADTVVCNVDVPVAYRTLLPGLRPPIRVRRTRYSPSATVWHAGVRGRPDPAVAHHNIHFGPDWDEAFRTLLHDGQRMRDPSLLVTVPTVSDPGLAPPGGTALFALEPVPNLDGRVDWTEERARARDDTARRLAALGYPDAVEVEAFTDPLDWERMGLERGTPFSASHRFTQSGPFRAPNVDPRAPGLVFVGAGTVPGVGIPMAVLSGRLAAARVEASRR